MNSIEMSILQSELVYLLWLLENSRHLDFRFWFLPLEFLWCNSNYSNASSLTPTILISLAKFHRIQYQRLLTDQIPDSWIFAFWLPFLRRIYELSSRLLLSRGEVSWSVLRRWKGLIQYILNWRQGIHRSVDSFLRFVTFSTLVQFSLSSYIIMECFSGEGGTD